MLVTSGVRVGAGFSSTSNHLIDLNAGSEAADNRQALINMIVTLSVIAFELKDQTKETDLNPVIVNCNSAVAVDGLLATAR
jgi:hypothetical protein